MLYKAFGLYLYLNVHLEYFYLYLVRVIEAAVNWRLSSGHDAWNKSFLFEMNVPCLV